ncbi:energy transducer TonB [Chondromyces crocatus]|uniref:TonB C-terminal domain-containing protein n=1 Tax=Chondromyces crocatus TaxID=52 RepID=A0A0K1EHP1_CHOCO|nr:energy transducer TonB [Chondromyces crocatus]AKT40093.1 uncharacterized protein CMC5_042460 [Chondromyces crocatus]
MPRTSLLYAASIAVHALLAASVLTIKQRERRENIAISVTESKKPPEPPKPIEAPRLPPPPEEKAPPRPAKARTVAEPKAEAPPPEAKAPSPTSAALDALPDFGLSLSGGAGPGLAVPAGGGPPPVAANAAPRPSATTPPPPKALAPRPVDDCTEAVVKPKPKRVPQPAYTASAREAGVEGRVRVEVTVGADGQITGARILSGLGHGLDEAALSAARSGSFEPATRCGKPVSATFVIAMRFSL